MQFDAMRCNAMQCDVMWSAVLQLLLTLLERDSSDVRESAIALVMSVLDMVCHSLPVARSARVVAAAVTDESGRHRRDGGGEEDSGRAAKGLVVRTLSLLRPWVAPHFELACRISRRFPAHVFAYVPTFTHSLEPRPSLQWLCNIALLCAFVQPVESSPSPLSTVVSTTSVSRAAAGALWCLPPTASKAALTRGLLHANKLVAFCTARLLVTALMRVGVGAEAGATVAVTGSATAAMSAVTGRLPEVQTLVAVVQGITKRGATLGASLLHAAVLAALRLCCMHAPALVAAARFDLLNLLDGASMATPLVLFEVWFVSSPRFLSSPCDCTMLSVSTDPSLSKARLQV
jgi:hypothetical protein